MGHATEAFVFAYIWTLIGLLLTLALFGVARLLLTLYHACAKLLNRRSR